MFPRLFQNRFPAQQPVEKCEWFAFFNGLVGTLASAPCQDVGSRRKRADISTVVIGLRPFLAGESL
jgi:hypothetical protein